MAVAAPRRLGGALADVPTWKEQGADVVYGLWRLAIGPKGMSAAQTACWESTLRKATQTPEWKSDMEQNFWSDEFVPGDEFRKNLAQEYGRMVFAGRLPGCLVQATGIPVRWILRESGGFCAAGVVDGCRRVAGDGACGDRRLGRDVQGHAARRSTPGEV